MMLLHSPPTPKGGISLALLFFCLLLLLLPSPSHSLDFFEFKNRLHYRIYLSPPFPSDFNPPKTAECDPLEMNEHGSDLLILHLLDQIKKKGKEGLSFRGGKSKVIITSTPDKANLIFLQQNLRTTLAGLSKIETKEEVEKFKLHVEQLKSRCRGCDFVMVYASGGTLGLREFQKSFPSVLSVGVDGATMYQKSKFADGTFTLPIPYPLSACNKNPHDYPLVSPFSHRPRLLFYYSSAHNLSTFYPHNPDKVKPIIYRDTAIDSIKLQVEQKGLGEDVVFAKRDIILDIKMKQNYEQYLSTSTFCLCPRGVTPASQRMMHVASFGCIPVILSDDYIPPFSAFIEPFYIEVKQDEVGTLVEKLQKMSLEDVRLLQENLEKYVKTWIWSWVADEENIPLDLMLHQLFALGDLNQWMALGARKAQDVPFRTRNKFDPPTPLLPSPLEKEMAKFYFSLHQNSSKIRERWRGRKNLEVSEKQKETKE